MDQQADMADDPALELAASRVRTAWIAASISASITTLFALIGLVVGPTEGAFSEFLDPWLLVDAALLWALVYYVRRTSFPASILLVAYWLMTIALSFTSGLSGGFVVKFLFLYYFINGARGAYALRSTLPRKPHSNMRRVLVWSIGGIAAVIVSALVILGTLIETGHVPDTEIATAETMQPRQLAELRENGIIEDDESIDLFYSAGMLSVLEDGDIITNRRVVSYWQGDEKDLQIASALFEEIEVVDILEKGDALNDTLILVTLKDGSELRLVAPVEGNGDRKFFQRINQLIER